MVLSKLYGYSESGLRGGFRPSKNAIANISWPACPDCAGSTSRAGVACVRLMPVASLLGLLVWPAPRAMPTWNWNSQIPIQLARRSNAAKRTELDRESKEIADRLGHLGRWRCDLSMNSAEICFSFQPITGPIGAGT